MLDASIRLPFTGHHQCLLGIDALPLGLGQDTSLDGLDHQRSLVPRSHFDGFPGVFRQRRTPAIRSQERGLGMPATTTVRRRFRRDVANHCVRGHGQEIPLVQVPQSPTKPGAVAHFVIAGNPVMRQQGTLLPKHFQSQFTSRLEAYLRGHAALLATGFVASPLRWQVQPKIPQRVPHLRYITEINADLTVLELAQTPTPLTLHAHRLRPFLRKTRRIENQDAFGFAQFLADLTHQFLHHRLVVPRGLTDEYLQRLAIHIVEISDRLRILLVELRYQARDVLLGTSLLFRGLQARGKWLNEFLQPWQHLSQHRPIHGGILQQLLHAMSKSSIHRRLLSEESFPERRSYKKT